MLTRVEDKSSGAAGMMHSTHRTRTLLAGDLPQPTDVVESELVVHRAQGSLSLPILTAIGAAISIGALFVLLHSIERWLGWPAIDWVSVAATGAVVGLVSTTVAVLTQTRGAQ